MQSEATKATYTKFRGELKPFDFEKVLAGATVVTRSRYEVHNLCKIGSQLYGEFCGQLPVTWNHNGRFPMETAEARTVDLLIGIPERPTFWTRMNDRVRQFLFAPRPHTFQKLTGALVHRATAFFLRGEA